MLRSHSLLYRPLFADRLFLILIVLGGMSARPAVAQNHSRPVTLDFHSIGSSPAWVTPESPDLKSPSPFPGPVRPGVYFRLADYQTHADRGETYFHFACEFLTAAGVHEKSEFEIDFDPAYQRLTIHRLLRHRGGAVTDLLRPELIRVTVPEDERSVGLLDGHVSVMLLPEDVRPGDVIEYDYTLSGQNPVFDGVFFDIVPMEWETTVGSLHYRLVRGKSRPPLQRRDFRQEIEPLIRDLPTTGEQEWIWRRKAIPPRLVETSVPTWQPLFATLELSEFADWSEVAQWGARHYDFSHLPVSPELKAKIETIRESHPTPESRVMAAIRFVQDEIRYLGIEDGINAFRPAEPNRCFLRRYGDCKDKAVLLGQMLKELGIDSDPVCVSHQWRHRVEDLLPSPIAFDHVVLRITLPDGRMLWCDATSSHQGGTVENLPFPHYGYGLVLHPSSTGLTATPAILPEDHRTEVVEIFHLGDIGEPARMEVITTYTGSEADSVRYHLKSDEPDSLRHSYLDYYRENYPTLEPDQPITVADDRESNVIVVHEHYLITSPWKPDPDDAGWYFFTVYLQAIRDALSQPDHARRELPYTIATPASHRHEMRFTLPGTDDDWAGFFDEERYVIESPVGTFERWMTYDPEKVSASIIGTYQSGNPQDAVDPADLEKFIKANRDIYELTSFDLWEVDDTQSAATADSSGAGSDLLDAEDWATSLALGFGAVALTFFGFCAGGLLTFAVMRQRAVQKIPPPKAAPPPLPPSAGSAP